MRPVAIWLMAFVCVVATAAGAAQFGPDQYPIRSDEGDPITNFDLTPELSARLVKLPGQISVGTAFFAADTTEGAVTRYRDLQVWPLMVEDVDEIELTPTVEATVEATAEPTVEPTLEPTYQPAPSTAANA